MNMMTQKGHPHIKIFSTLSGVKIVVLNFITIKYSLH